jgi:hypothetical protein
MATSVNWNVAWRASVPPTHPFSRTHQIITQLRESTIASSGTSSPRALSGFRTATEPAAIASAEPITLESASVSCSSSRVSSAKSPGGP